jgi:hypothetical protein
VAIQPEDLEALRAMTVGAPVGAVQAAGSHTTRTDLKDGKVIALESYRPVSDSRGDASEDMKAYALHELEPFLKLAREGKVRALVVVAELVDEQVNITYPVGQWEPGLIAATELMRMHLLQQGQ